MDTSGAPGPPYHPQDHPAHLRATDAEREIVAEMVRSAVSDGRLTIIEVDERLGAVYEARTHGELSGVIADLFEYRPTPPPPPYPPPAAMPMAVPVPVYYSPQPGVSHRKVLPALLLCLFTGVMGGHQFFTGKVGTGIAMIVLLVVTLGVVPAVWAFIDLIVIITGNFRDADGNILKEWT